MLRSVCLTLVLASCAVVETPQIEPRMATDQVALDASPPTDLDFMPLRIGVEYLAPRRHDTDHLDTLLVSETTPRPDTVRITALRPPSTGRATPVDLERSRREAETSPWMLTRNEIEAIEDPAERLTMLFVDDLAGEDRLRMQRELRTPILTNRFRYTMSEALRMPHDEQEAEEEASFLNNAAPSLLRRPLRNLLRRATFIQDFEIALKKFKAENVPLSNAYRQKNRRHTEWGRVSLRLRLSDGSDPAEVSYYNWGWRIGSSKERSRVQYRFRIADKLQGSVRFRFNYESHDSAIRADVRYVIDDRTHLNLLLGDRLDFLAGPTAYSFLNSPLDGTPGVLFYVEHLF